jgi:hypothetical protein
MEAKDCRTCGKKFQPVVGNQVYCSKKCSDKYWGLKNYWEHREKRLSYIKQDKVKERQKELKKTDKYKKVRNDNIKKRRRNDLQWKLGQAIKDRIRKDGLLDYKGVSFSKSKLEEYLGYTITELSKALFDSEEIKAKYLNSELEIDHIIQYNRFIIQNVGDEEFKKCWNMRNLRLISKEDNIKRSFCVFPWKEIEERNLSDILPKGAKEIWDERNNNNKI